MFIRTLLAALALAACAGHPQTATTPPSESEWTSLFNGSDLTGWNARYVSAAPDARPASALFRVEDGVIHVYPDDVAGTTQAFAVIQTDAEYRDYRLSLEYRWGEKKFQPRAEAVRDAGLLYHNHGPLRLDWPYSVESQIQEGDTGDTWAVSTQVTSTVHPDTQRYATPADGGQPVTVGEFNNFHRVRHGRMNEVEGWNTLEVIIRGDTAVHIVNGVVNMRVTDMRAWDPASSSWVRLDHGKISLQAEGAELYYRNIRIRPLNASDVQ
jgi:hypothetical protein